MNFEKTRQNSLCLFIWKNLNKKLIVSIYQWAVYKERKNERKCFSRNSSTTSIYLFINLRLIDLFICIFLLELSNVIKYSVWKKMLQSVAFKALKTLSRSVYFINLMGGKEGSWCECRFIKRVGGLDIRTTNYKRTA